MYPLLILAISTLPSIEAFFLVTSLVSGLISSYSKDKLTLTFDILNPISKSTLKVRVLYTLEILLIEIEYLGLRVFNSNWSNV